MNRIEELFEEPANVSIPAWQRLQAGDNTASAEFLSDMQPTIDKAIASFAGNDPAYKTQARILALDAVKTFDNSRGADIKTHVFNNLKRLQRISAQRGNFTKIPENSALQLNVVKRAWREFEADNGIEPTTEQLASITGFSRKRIDSLLNLKPVTLDSLAVNPEGDSIQAYDRNRSIDIYNDMIYNELSATDKLIYEWNTGYGKGVKLSNIEIAKRLNISPAAVSKRLANIANKFAEGRELVKEFV